MPGQLAAEALPGSLSVALTTLAGGAAGQMGPEEAEAGEGRHLGHRGEMQGEEEWNIELVYMGTLRKAQLN